MKIKYLTALFLAIFFYSCEKSNPEIASTDDLSSISYQEEIYTQPIVAGAFIVSVQHKDNTHYLTAFNPQGAVEWSIDIESYLIQGTDYEQVDFYLSKNKSREIFLNFLSSKNNGTEILKVVRFSDTGDYLNQFTDSIHQNIPENISDARNFNSLGILPLDNGNVAIVSFLSDLINQTTYIQMSEYSESGSHLNDTTYEISEAFIPKQVFLASNNRLVFQAGATIGLSYFIIFNLENGNVFKSPEFPVFDLLSFYENSQGNFIFTASAFVDNLEYYGLIFSISSKAAYLWHEAYTEKSAYLLMNTTEVSDGYIFTGFDITGQLLNKFDWRSSLINEKTFGIIMKTDSKGKNNNSTGWQYRIMSPASTAGAAVLQNEKGYTFFGAKFDRDIKSTFILKFDQTGKILN